MYIQLLQWHSTANVSAMYILHALVYEIKNEQTFGGFHFSVHDSGVILDTSSGPSGAPGLSRIMTRMVAVSDPLLFRRVTE